MWEGVIRPVDFDLMSRLDKVLTARYPYIDVPALDDDYSSLAGTPPARIYRSFIRRREDVWKDVPPRVSVDPAAFDKYIRAAVGRAAVQIDLAYRQLEADRSSYLRNTDIHKNYRLSDSQAAHEVTAAAAVGVAVGAKCTDPGLTHTPSRPQPRVNPIVLVLDNLRSAYNVGTIFRTAETAGVS